MSIISFILSVLIEMASSAWSYENAYMTVCHEVVECGLVNDMSSKSTKCSWYDNGVAVRPGMFDSYCDPCTYGTYKKCEFNLPYDGLTSDRWVNAQVCNGEQAQTCYVECGAEVCIKRADWSTNKVFYKTGRTVSSCPQNHPVNNQQCCDNKDWAHCTCLKRPTVDVSDEVYNALGGANSFVDIWYGSCGDLEYSATNDYSIKLINEDGLSQYYYAIATRPYNPNFYVTYVAAKSKNSNYYYKCDQQSYDKQVWKCDELKNAVGSMEGPISLEIYTSFTDNGGKSYRYIKKENVISLTSNQIKLVDLYTDGSAFTADEHESNLGPSTTETIVIISAVLLVIGLICVGGYWFLYKKRNKSQVSFDENVEEDGLDKKDNNNTTGGYDMSPINTGDNDIQNDNDNDNNTGDDEEIEVDAEIEQNTLR